MYFTSDIVCLLNNFRHSNMPYFERVAGILNSKKGHFEHLLDVFKSSNCQFHIMILQKANFWQCLKSGDAENYKRDWTCFSRNDAQTNSTKFEEEQIYQGKKFSNGCLCILSDSQGKRYQGWLSYTAISIYTSTVLLLPFLATLVALHFTPVSESVVVSN